MIQTGLPVLSRRPSMIRLPFGKPKRCLETDGVEIAKAYEKVYELERRLSLLESRRILIRIREPKTRRNGEDTQ